MADKFNVIRLSEDAAGESHFDAFEMTRELTKFAPPAMPFLVSPVQKATGYVIVRIPVGWAGELHPSPYRQMVFCWSGALKVTATDGGVRTIGPGDVWLGSDNHGKATTARWSRMYRSTRLSSWR